MWDGILDGSIYSCPSLLASFLILSYADLKKYKFHHLFAFPTFSSTPQWTCTAPIERLDAQETSSLVEAINAWRSVTDAQQHGFFLVKRQKPAGEPWKVGELGEFEKGFFGTPEEEVPESDRLVGFVDPSTYPDNPGWPLRNLLMLVRKRWGWRKARVLCYRDAHAAGGGRHEPKSLIMECGLEEEGEEGIGDLNLGGKGVPILPGVVAYPLEHSLMGQNR